MTEYLRAPIWQPDRYVSLAGQKINSDCIAVSFPHTLVSKLDLEVMTVGAILGGIISYARSREDLLPHAIDGAFLAELGNYISSKFVEEELLRRHFKAAVDYNCIDTEPGPSTVPTINRFAVPVSGSLRSYKFHLAASVILTMGSVAGTVATGSPHLVKFLEMFTGHGVRMYEGTQRFQRIHDGTYEVVRWPVPAAET